MSHVSKERHEWLVKDEVLPTLDFIDFGTYIYFIKGKQVKSTKKGTTRSARLLEIVYIDICGPFSLSNISGEKYFITFIDDFSCYSYIHLIKEKSNALNVFKIFKVGVENQLYGKIKVVRFDRCSEYYGKHDEIDHNLGIFTRLLQENGIIAHYTMLGTTQ